MNLTSVKYGDIVEVNKRGRLFLAFVEAKEAGKIQLKPLDRNVNYFEASAREVMKHWRRAGARDKG